MKQSCNVTNKSAGRTVYLIKEDNIRRTFFPNETKRNIPVSELEKLVQQPGGLSLLYNRLFIDDMEIVRHLINGEEVPEYWLKEEDIPAWMEKCSLDEFKDALDFAPQGTKDLIKQYAVSLPLNDYSKREAIRQQLNFDVTNAISNQGEDTEKVEEPKNATSRRTTSTTIKTPVVTPSETKPVVVSVE